ncbi:ABC transporter ATP-binding protein [Actinosynnema sp. CA-248983]
MTGVELAGVRAAHDRHDVLRGVDLVVPRGELLAVLGPSGAGKSTLLRVVAGLHPVSAGTVRIAGRDVTATSPGERDVAMVFQSHALFPHLTVADNIAFGHRVRGLRRGPARAIAARAAEVAGCEHLLDRRPHQLSGGERQRVALARALVREPAVFLLDEPLSNLDASLRERTRAELRALHDRVGATMLHVTHDRVEALTLGDRVAVVRDGLVEQVGTPEEVWRRPATQFVGTFVGPMNVLPGDGPWRADAHRVGFRQEAVRLVDNGVPGRVARVEVVGEDAYVHLDVSSHPVVARVPTVGRPVVGTEVFLEVKDLHLFDESGKRV